METIIIICQILIVGAVVFNNLWWSKRQKDYFQSISPVSVLGNLKALNDLLETQVKETEKFASKLKKIEQERDDLRTIVNDLETELKEQEEHLKIESDPTSTTTPIGVDFTNLFDLGKKLNAYVEASNFEAISNVAMMSSKNLIEIQQYLARIMRTRDALTGIKAVKK